MEFIFEVKTHSPFQRLVKRNWDELFELANNYGDIISIHTDPLWNGNFELLKKARALTKKPILAKGLHRSDDQLKQALDIGADYVLVVGRLPKVFNERYIIEPLNLWALNLIPHNYKVLWNQRDIFTGERKIGTFDEARNLFPGYLIQGSFIKNWNDVNVSANAILVGTNLKEFLKGFTKNDKKSLKITRKHSKFAQKDSL